MAKWECLVCEQSREADVFYPFCSQCGQPLIIPPPKARGEIDLTASASLKKFRSFLSLPRVDEKFTLGEGNTPLLRLYRLEKKLGLSFPLLAKNEMANPTHSFKDRGTAVVIQHAVQSGIKNIGTVSTGNMAASTAAYGAKAGLKTFILLKEDAAVEKTISTGIYGASLFQVKGDYGELFWKSLQVGKKLGIYFANSCDPYRLQGYQLTSLEIYLQLGRRGPQYVFVPVSSGGHLTGLLLGFLELKKRKMIARLPHFVGVQASGCAPLSQAWVNGKDQYTRIKKPHTVAHAISNPAPPAGNLVLHLLRKYGGSFLSVSDREIIKAQWELALREGLFCDPAAATPLAGLKKWLRLNPQLKPANVVLILTGSGLKDLAPVKEEGKISLISVSISGLEEALCSLTF